MFQIYNRRYTGSKYKLLDWIESKISDNCEGEILFDVFAGTGVVSDRLKENYKKIIINDFLYSNNVIYNGFMGGEKYRETVIDEFRKKYQEIVSDELKDNYFSINFGGKYFSQNDARIIGYIRDDIEKNRERLNQREQDILLASLIYSMDKVANTVGHYEAYRRIGYIDDRFLYDLIQPVNTECEISIYRRDANELARQVQADIAFVDPPYNSRQYSRFYHVLETVTKWEKPKLEGVALKPPVENMSEYCRNTAPIAFKDLVDNLNVKYIVVTYNNTYHSRSTSSQNKITLEEITEILTSRGKTDVFEQKHQCFNAGKTDFDDHKEFLFITKVGVF